MPRGEAIIVDGPRQLISAAKKGVVHQRFAAFHGFDLRALVLERLQELKAKQEQRQSSA